MKMHKNGDHGRTGSAGDSDGSIIVVRSSSSAGVIRHDIVGRWFAISWDDIEGATEAGFFEEKATAAPLRRCGTIDSKSQPETPHF